MQQHHAALLRRKEHPGDPRLQSNANLPNIAPKVIYESHPQRRQPLARGRAPNLSLSSPHLNGVMSLRRTAPPQFPHPIPLPPHTGHPVTRVNSQLHSGLILMQPPHGQWSGTLTPWIRPSCLPNACLLICVCASMSSSCNFLFILRYV